MFHTKNTRDTKNTKNGLVYASGGLVTLYVLYMPPAAMRYMIYHIFNQEFIFYSIKILGRRRLIQ